MASVDKEEFAPLFAPGRLRMTLAELTRRCVDPFPTSASRPRLIQRLAALVDALTRAVGACDVWIDGSFVSTKQDPDDIDLSIVVEGDVFDSLDVPVQTELIALMDEQRLGPDLHVFVAVSRPLGHRGHADTAEFISEMAEWWSVARRGWLKGMPVIRIGETDVGIRILP